MIDQKYPSPNLVLFSTLYIFFKSYFWHLSSRLAPERLLINNTCNLLKIFESANKKAKKYIEPKLFSSYCINSASETVYIIFIYRIQETAYRNRFFEQSRPLRLL